VEFLFKFETICGATKTTNLLESWFKVLKTKTQIHSGLKRENLEKFIANFLSLKKCLNFGKFALTKRL